MILDLDQISADLRATNGQYNEDIDRGVLTIRYFDHADLINISDIKGITLGMKSSCLAGIEYAILNHSHPKEYHPWKFLTLHLPSRTVDLEFANSRDICAANALLQSQIVTTFLHLEH